VTTFVERVEGHWRASFCRLNIYGKNLQALVDNEESPKYNVIMAKVINRNLKYNE
jgi:hypothetical protein